MNVLLCATIRDGQRFAEKMGLDINLIVPRGNYQVLRGLKPPEHIWRTPAYLQAPDPVLEREAGLLEAIR